MLFKIALKNLLGARLRTFLNVFVTCISFFMIIFITGLYDGMRQHAKQVTIDTEIAGGAYWHPLYILQIQWYLKTLILLCLQKSMI